MRIFNELFTTEDTEDHGGKRSQCHHSGHHWCGDEGPLSSWSGIAAYQACLAYELRKSGFDVKTEVELPVIYDGVYIDLGYRIDLIINERIIVELKCVEKIAPIHEAQIISCLRLSKKSVGLLINFHVRHLRDGIKRFVEGTDWN